MWPILAALVTARGSCEFLDNHCFLQDPARVTCLLQGDTQPNEPSLDSIVGQTLAAENQLQSGCPQISLSSTQILELYLLPCEGMFSHVQGHLSSLFDTHGKIKSAYITKIPAGTCNQSVFSISNAMLDDNGAKLFRGGIAIQNSAKVDYSSHTYKDRPRDQKKGGFVRERRHLQRRQ